MIIGFYGKMLIIGLFLYVVGVICLIFYLIGDGIGSGIKGVEYFVFEVCEY